MPSTSYKINVPHVVHEVFDDEVVIVNLDTGTYYSLEAVGAEIWRSIAERASVDDISETVALKYDGNVDEIRSAVDRLLDELQQEYLVVACEESKTIFADRPDDAESRRDLARSRTSFSAPTLHRFTDMQELLLLDPVHDVDETGWPRPRSAPDPAAEAK